MCYSSQLIKRMSLFCFLVKELSTMHDKHLNRPTLDDSVDEEQTIEITTKEITQVSIHLSLFLCNVVVF